LEQEKEKKPPTTQSVVKILFAEQKQPKNWAEKAPNFAENRQKINQKFTQDHNKKQPKKRTAKMSEMLKFSILSDD